MQEEFHQIPDHAHAPIGESGQWAAGSPHIFPPKQEPSDPTCLTYIPFATYFEAWSSYSFNANLTQLAIAQTGHSRGAPNKPVVHVYDLVGANKGQQKILAGHHGRVDSVMFSPTDPYLLVTAAAPGMPSTTKQECEIFCWNLSPNFPMPTAPSIPEEILQAAADRAVDAVDQHGFSSGPSFDLTDGEREMFTGQLLSSLQGILGDRRISGLPKLHGRLPLSFNSCPFSRDGTRFIYMPGERPNSNGKDDRWTLAIYNITTHQVGYELKGNQDAIMWTGWSHSDRWIMTVCWDRTVRVWDAQTGQEKWRWMTKGQNWTGHFGPPSKNGEAEYVLATCGAAGTVICWSLVDGSQLWTFDPQLFRPWCRALSISYDGRYLAVGGKGGGSVAIVDLKTEPIDGKREAVTIRKLGNGGVVAPLNRLEEDEGDPEKKAQSEKRAIQMVVGLIECRNLRFFGQRYRDDGDSQTQAGQGRENLEGSTTRLSILSNIDYGLEVYDIGTNKKWRCAPETPPLPKEDESQQWGRRGEEGGVGPEEMVGFECLSDNGEDKIWSVHSDGARLWRLEA